MQRSLRAVILQVNSRVTLKLITHKDEIRITEDVLLGAMSMQR